MERDMIQKHRSGHDRPTKVYTPQKDDGIKGKQKELGEESDVPGTQDRQTTLKGSRKKKEFEKPQEIA